MKKALIIFSSLMIVSVTCFATIPVDHPKLAEYFAARYVTLTYLADSHDIDFKEVQAVLFDGNGYISLKHAPTSPGTWGKGHYWVFFKNGTWVILGPTPESKTAWQTYKDCLKANPQFLSIP